MLLPGVMEHAEILALRRWRQEDQEYASLDYIVILKPTWLYETHSDCKELGNHVNGKFKS